MRGDQRRFSVLGRNLHIIVSKLATNQNLCRLLHYTDKTPLDPDKPDVDGIKLINKNIRLVPKLPDELETKENFILVTFGNFTTNPVNNEFKSFTVRINIICPFDEWLLDGVAMRPYLLMSEVDEELNQQRIAGIGRLVFNGGYQLVVSPELAGYSLEYLANEFN